MENIETTEVKAQGRVRLLTVIVVMLVVIGGVVEYKRLNAPTDEMVVVYKTSKKAEKVKEFTKEEDVKPVATVKEKNEDVKFDNAVENFFGYFDKVREDLETVTEPVSALDNIVQAEPVEEVKEKATEVFEEGKIEIYDSEKGVVAKEDAPVVTEEVAEVKENDSAEVAVEVEPEVVAEQVVEPEGEEVSLDDVYEDEEVPLDEVNVEVNEVPVEVVEENKEVVESAKVSEAKEVIEEAVEETVDVAEDIKENVSEVSDKPTENVDAEEEAEVSEDDVSKAKSEIENINVNIDNGDFEEEVAGGNGDSVTMKFGEEGVSIEGPEGVALKIDENGLSIGGMTVDMPEYVGESEEELDENAEAIVNKFKNVNNENIKDVNDEAINLLQGINMQNN